MTVVIIKQIAPITYHYIMTGEVNWYDESFEYVIVIFVNFISWPITLFGIICFFFLKLIFLKILIPMILKLFRFIGSITPNIKISMKDDDD
jgi:hypothetical protein